ncbi:small GTP-binding protein domain protein [Vittaforma corneae ATCC 50505]|uniref:Small GTP-binding protein domain protein n=1 Tax=Vittaforma corneae (strain ATCC 50505) TaxID=993615 RepID=L2GMU7_VITCO|nr:small GTP-binding protein domain protein [Vittaforma corneae ATCC 50505]ELA42141.1 small GTP-binding protein domain protein [Vittaforma corneae ATCC 50505]
MSEATAKPLINICIIGHVDSGKSTLCGQLATKFGTLDERQQAKLAKIAEENQKGSFTLAYFTDRTEQERKRGVTINTTLVEMQTTKFKINFLDCPGHADYIKNATSGCKQSDLSIVVVPADFQASCSADGTLKTHLTLAAILGSKSFIVCINKLDEVAEKARKADGSGNVNSDNLKPIFDAAVAAVGKLLKKLVPDPKSIIYLPVSALHGIGIFKDGKKFDFFEGYIPPEGKAKPGFEKITSLEEAIDFQETPKRPTDQRLRIPVSSLAHVPGQGPIICGRVDYGILTKGMLVKDLPLGFVGEVKNIQAHKQDVEAGVAGMNIGFSLKIEDKNKAPLIEKVTAGHMIGDAKDESFNLYPFYLVSCVSLKGKSKSSGQEEKGIKSGYTPVVSCGTSNIASKFVKLVSAVDRDSNAVVENPPFIAKDQKFTALIYPTKQALFEGVKSFPNLGKFVCRDSGVLVAVGQIIECVSEEKALSEYGVDLKEVTGTKPTGSVTTDKKGKKK